MENTTQLFLAVRFNCNKCHDHPFERWTQDQYYHLAAFFAQVGRTEDPQLQGPEGRRHRVEGRQPLVEIIADGKAGEVKHMPHRRRRHADVSLHAQRPGAGRRPAAASNWPTGSPSKDNPYFARSYVNRLWSYLLGVGIIEPVDDIRAGNPPSNPQAARPADRGVRQERLQRAAMMLKTICKSRTYQHSVVSQQLEPGRRHQLRPRPAAPAAGRGALRRHPAGHRAR